MPELPEYEWRSRGATLYYLQTVEETDTMLRRLSDKLKHNKEQGSSVIGFDLEWRPNYKPGRKENPVALVQLATEDEVFLVQVHWMKSKFFRCWIVTFLLCSDRCCTYRDYCIGTCPLLQASQLRSPSSSGTGI